jgi:hypothetical protein
MRPVRAPPTREGAMKITTLLTTLALSFAAAFAHAADNPHLGTWKLNEAKSKIAEGTGRNTSVSYEAVGDGIKVVVQGAGADGKAVRNEWTGRFDGKDYPVTGDPTSDTRSYTVVDDRTLSFSAKKAGKPTLSGEIVISADGKSRTVTTVGTNSKGDTVNVTAVYDRQ